jgi:phosphopantetheine adenylyltransferase/predicted metal-dependent HD superfamily phosphohydrolase
MSVNFRIQSGHVSFDQLRSEGFSLETIARTVSQAVTVVQNRLVVYMISQSDPTQITALLGIVDILYNLASLAMLKTGHLALDFSCAFNLASIAEGSVELAPQTLQSAPGTLNHKFVVPGALAVPLMLLEPRALPIATFQRVLFAGTFDHLHCGHRNILTKALFSAERQLFVGIASEDLLKHKRFANCLEPFDLRKSKLHHFLESIRPEWKRDVEIIYLETRDAVGPAATLEFDAIFVTPETAVGASLVNEARAKRGMPPVKVVEVDLLGHTKIETKLSSSDIRDKLCKSLPKGEDQLNELYEKWIGLATELAIDDNVARSWWSRLRDFYGLQPWRHYHNLRHVSELLSLVSEEYQDRKPPSELLLAVWFHDAVYHPLNSSSEDDSISLFREFVARTSIQVNADAVTLAIQYTKSHRAHISCDCQVSWIPIFLEADLSILGSEIDRYHEYSNQIKSEYSHLLESEFKDGRRVFLDSYKDFVFKHLKSGNRLSSHLSDNLREELSQIS